jgi:hypothetical protein
VRPLRSAIYSYVPSAHAIVSWRRWPTPLFYVPGTPLLDNGTANVWKIAGRYLVGFFFPSAAPPIAATGSYAQGSCADVSKYLLRHIIQRTRSQNRSQSQSVQNSSLDTYVTEVLPLVCKLVKQLWAAPVATNCAEKLLWDCNHPTCNRYQEI